MPFLSFQFIPSDAASGQADCLFCSKIKQETWSKLEVEQSFKQLEESYERLEVEKQDFVIQVEDLSVPLKGARGNLSPSGDTDIIMLFIGRRRLTSLLEIFLYLYNSW